MAYIVSPERETQLKSQLEILSRLGAALLIGFYAAGFLVVTFANASRGIVGFGFLRAKILTAGILFAFFMVLPLIDWSRVFGKFGFPAVYDWTIGRPTAADSRPISLGVVRMFSFLMWAWAMAFFLCTLLLNCVFGGRFFAFYVVLIGVGVAAFRLFSKHPVTSVVISLGVTAFGIAALIFFKEERIALLLGWFVVVGLTADLVEKDVRQAQHPRHINWHLVVLYIVSTVSYFATLLYPKISPRFGGGEPTQAVFQFANPSPIDGSTKDKLWMLDEVDAGYYVLKDPSERKAIFIPRGLVSAIYFDAGQH